MQHGLINDGYSFFVFGPFCSKAHRNLSFSITFTESIRWISIYMQQGFFLRIYHPNFFRTAASVVRSEIFRTSETL